MTLNPIPYLVWHGIGHDLEMVLYKKELTRDEDNISEMIEQIYCELQFYNTYILGSYF